MVRKVNRCLLFLCQQDMYGVGSAYRVESLEMSNSTFKGAKGVMQRMTQGM